MQKRIYKAITLIVMTAILIFGVSAIGISYEFYRKNVENELKGVAGVLLSENYDVEQIADKIEKSLEYRVRTTFIDMNGNVLFDSEVNSNNMENHLDRTEIKEAIKDGVGYDTRVSDTLGKNTFYYASKYRNGIIRFGIEMKSIYTVFIGIIPIIISVAGIVLIVSTIVSIKISENIIKPLNSVVNQIDIFDENSDDKVEIKTDYEELEPITRTIDRMMNRIQDYIEKLKTEKNTIELITDNMVEGMVILDKNNNVISVNKSALKLLNPKFKENQKNHTRNIVELTRNRGLLSILDELGENESIRGVFQIENKYIKAFINRVEMKETNGVIILLVDVTESTKAEEIRKDFSANVSHELKTPLTTIKGFGEMLENGIITDEEQIKHYGQIIFRESTRLLNLINDIIRLSEIEERSKEELPETDIYKIAENVIEILSHKAEKNEISLSLKGESCVIRADEGYINELLINLADNAIKYNNPHGKVEIEINGKKNGCEIKVRDNGIGISEEHGSRIFERFYRVDKSRSKQTGGTGLGLSIVKHIVNYHKGSLDFRSKLGEGTEITVFLPKD